MKKITTILILIVASTITCTGQTIQGKYIWTDPSGLSSKVLYFYKNKFNQTEYSDIDSLKGSGYFIQDERKLILVYDKVLNKDVSSCSVIKLQESEEERVNKTSISLTIKDNENSLQPFHGVSIFLGHQTGNSIQLFSDTGGHSEFIIWDLHSINQFTIVAMGYDPILVPTKEFANKNVLLNCILRIPKTRFITKDKVEFNIEELSKNSIVISKDNEKLRFNKVNR